MNSDEAGVIAGWEQIPGSGEIDFLRLPGNLFPTLFAKALWAFRDE